MLSVDNDTDLGVPSPPKALNGIRQRLGLGLDEDDSDAGSGTGDDALLLTPTRGRRTGRTLLARTSSIISSYSTLLSPRRNSEPDEDDDQDVTSTHSSPLRPSSEARSFTGIALPPTEDQDVPSTQSSPARPKPDSFITSALSTTSVDDLSRTSSIYSAQSTSTLIPGPPVSDSASTRGGTWPRQKSNPSNQSRPFFEPSELEEIMAPLKEEFMRKQADKLEQAKAAYEQLNEQLMSELPQLIDLRCVFLVSIRGNGLRDELNILTTSSSTESPTSTPRSKRSSRSNYASARKLTAAWRKCNNTSMLRRATSMPVAISTHGWRMF